MDSIHIKGGVALQGKVRIQGSKNAALPVLAATLLTKEVSYIRNCPRIADVYLMISLLGSLGCNVSWEDGGIRVDAGNVCEGEMPVEAIKGMRSSLCLLGAMLGRCGEIVMEHPGGCIIGERPIDIHLAALTRMGVSFKEEEGRLYAKAEKLNGAEITLPFASVGATENILLAAVAAEGNTVIKGAAREPEITALCSYLQCCGALIEGIGTDCITVHGGISLHGGDFCIPADRIVAGTYLFGCIATGGTIFLEDAPVKQMEAAVELAERMGSKCDDTGEGLFVQSPKRPILPPLVRTVPYPGFPTDLQSMALAAMTVGEGECIIEETIFENRFRVVEPLRSMGADIEELDSKRVLVKGADGLIGRTVEAMELRGGAALVLAGLAAQGKTKVMGCSYIYRGYENICRDLRELGARVIIA
ncbi:MAG: UDP-N-acetylglucosamine 1-carboxyvinyltransferase [Lachnoclostridium sp.]|nr:UDP-N-acetylglucosamine 1-carboxyvinyltransferase [Lachnospira sp.]MCM1247124.1 UDP-N-acetylglucosamine 1-carboxyvinyltransferase [Lachnoclostridium sp.]